MAYGAGRSEALAATLVLRVATLAVPCLVGVLSLVLQPDLQRLRSQKAATTSSSD
jgi:hypothetical protein